MPRNYEYKEVAVQELLLDEENPRFASSILVKESTNKITQEMIIEHLLRYSDVIKLAQRINEVGELHGSEIILVLRRVISLLSWKVTEEHVRVNYFWIEN